MLVYGRSDLGPWSPWSESVLLSAPVAFYAFAAFGYVLATGVTRADASMPRTATAAVGCLVIPFVTFKLSLPLLFAIGENGSYLAGGIAFGVLALPTAAFQVLVTRRGITVSLLEFFSYVCATAGTFLVRWILSWPLGDPDADRIFGDWPFLLTLAPFVALAASQATVVPSWRSAWACLLAAIPIYSAMAILDIKDRRGVEAALWPARVWSDFISTNEQLALAEAVTTIRPGIPVRIGEHWYRFEHSKVAVAWPPPLLVRRPDRIIFLQLDVPADDVDLTEMRIIDDYVQLDITTASLPSRLSADELERGGTYVAISDLDLIVSVVAPRNRDIDRTIVRNKLRQFIQNARVEPPTGAAQP